MNKRLSYWALYCLLLVSAACGSVPNKGIEVGNPGLKGKVLTLTPKGLPETFLLDFEADGDVLATRILGNEFDTTAGTLENTESFAQITATFADSTLLEVELTLDESGEIANVVLHLNGLPVELESATLNTKAMARPNFELAALGIAEQLCLKLVECGAEAPDDACAERILDIPGLAPSLGGSNAQTLRNMQDELSSGGIETDAPNLETCLWDILQVPCPQVHKARPPSNPKADSSIRHMIPRPSCASGFKPSAN